MITATVLVAVLLAGCGRSASPDTGKATLAGGAAARPVAPSLSGLDATSAASAIEAAGLRVGTVTESYSTTVPAGGLISNSLVPGSSVPKGTAVDLNVSKGQQPGTVPSTIGMAERAARSVLTKAGYKVTRASRVDSAALGTVVAQEPVGTKAKRGSSVLITVSEGPVPLASLLIGGWKAADGTTYTFKAGNRVAVPSGGVIRYRYANGMLLVMKPGAADAFIVVWVTADELTFAPRDATTGAAGKPVTYTRVR